MKLLLTILLAITFNSYGARERTIDIAYKFQADQNWLTLAATEEGSIRALLQLLKRSDTGIKILKLAKKKAAREGKTLTDVISVGETSLCDTTLTRKFYPSAPDKTIYISKSHVYINKDLVVADAVLDLAHELTHFTYRKAFNPYRLSFTLEDFIKSTIEGRGGEVEAYMVECKVQGELFHKDYGNRSYCGSIVDRKIGRVTKLKGMQQFYKIGSYYPRFRTELLNFGIASHDLSMISEEFPLFISSAYGVPYPVAAYKEYVNIMEKSCENDLKRLAIMREKSGRFPAAINTMKKHYERRCLNLYVDKF